MLQIGCVNNKKITSEEQMVLNKVISDIMVSENLKEIIVSNKYKKWNIGVDVDFDVPGYALPTTRKEREERLKSEIIDPYKIWYVFAYPITDSLFTKEDKEYISRQMKDTTVKNFPCELKNIKLVEPKDGEVHGYYFCRPAFNKNHKYAIIRKYENYSISDDGTLFGETQTLYYGFDSKRGWIKIFAGGKWQ